MRIGFTFINDQSDFFLFNAKLHHSSSNSEDIQLFNMDRYRQGKCYLSTDKKSKNRKKKQETLQYTYTYIYVLYIYMYIYKLYSEYGFTVSEKSVFPTSFGRGRFQGNLFIYIYIYILNIYIKYILYINILNIIYIIYIYITILFIY